MALDLFNKIQIGTTWLTSDGTSTGIPVLSEVKGLDAFKPGSKLHIILAADGSPTAQVIANQKGLFVSITVTLMPQTMFDTVNTAINTAMTNSTTIALSIAGDTGTFNLTTLPGAVNGKPIDFNGEFQNAKIKKVTYNFTTT